MLMNINLPGRNLEGIYGKKPGGRRDVAGYGALLNGTHREVCKAISRRWIYWHGSDTSRWISSGCSLRWWLVIYTDADLPLIRNRGKFIARGTEQNTFFGFAHFQLGGRSWVLSHRTSVLGFAG